MKKIVAAVLACLMIGAVFAGCSDPLKNSSSSQPAATEATKEDETVTETATEEEKTYENTIDGLCDYLMDKGYVTGKVDGVSKNASIIKADESRFYKGSNCSVELYLYTKESPTKLYPSIAKDHTVTLYGKTISNVYVTDSEKYLMIYNDSSASDKNSDNYKKMQSCVNDFNEFESVAANASDDSKKSEKTEKETESETEKAE